MPPPSPAIKPASDAYVQPISPTTIIQVQFAPDSLSGSRLAWVVAVRADTSWFARRLDIETIELKPGFFGWKYRTGPYEYRLAFNGRHHLVIDETEIDLRQHTMVFVSLDRRTGRANEVRPGAFVSFVSATPRTRAEYDRLIAALPGLTEFANAVR
jgi:hypothetical protein